MYNEREATRMEISNRALDQHLQELRWIQQELMCVLPATVHNKAVCSSIDECIDRLKFAIYNINMHVTNLTKKKEKQKCSTKK